MHNAMLAKVIKACRQRQNEGDCTVTPSFSTEILEDAVVQLADALKIAKDPDNAEWDAGVMHPEAPSQEAQILIAANPSDRTRGER